MADRHLHPVKDIVTQISLQAPPDKSLGESASAYRSLEPGETPSEPFLRWLQTKKADIVDLWVDRLANLSASYRKRPTSELFTTVTMAFNANQAALETGSLAKIDHFIDFITDKRLRAGFPLSDVQGAFELFRTIVIEMLTSEKQLPVLAACLLPLNSLLAYTISKFSDHFQKMHELAIRKHASNLERKVHLRTAELAESERKYKALVNDINDGYFIVQAERIAFANDAFCRMHGVSWQEVAGKRFASFVAPDFRDKVISTLREAISKHSASGQLEYSRSGCAPHDAFTEMKYKVVDLGQGSVTIGICRDISRRVAMEAKVREHERMAYIGNIAASLSHEIRNPLSTCTLNMLILKDKLDLDGFDRRRLDITVRELTRLEEILRQLLDLSSPLNLKLDRVHLAEVARDCGDLLAGRIAEKKITLRQVHWPQAPAVQADFDKMEQALLNLLLNAVEAVEPGGRITVWTKYRESPEGHCVDLGVHDNGHGISPQQQANLFTPFATNKSRGTGLGLSNVKRITQAHGGSILVKSHLDVGTSFILRFPCKP